MTQIKVLILDIDGTIAGKSNQVNEAVRKAIRAVQNKGIQVGLATGRMYCSAQRFHETINAQLPVIAYNGAWIQNPIDGELYSHLPVPKHLASELLDYFQQPDLPAPVEVHFYFDDCLYVRQISEQTESYLQRSGIAVKAVGDLRSLLTTDPTKVLAASEDCTLIQRMLRELQARHQGEDLFLTQSNQIYLEATHVDVHKGAAIKYLTEKILGLSPEQVMAIGDNFNDLTMLEYAGVSVAMGDAPELVRDVADWVAPDVENDGVAAALERFIL